MMDLSEATRQCARLTRAASSTFHLGTWFLRSDRRRAVHAIYAACRTGDDLADTGDPEAKGRLGNWCERIERAFSGAPRADPIEIALSWAVERFGIPRHPFEAMYQGFLDEARFADDPAPFATLDELLGYSYRVAGTVGEMTAPVLGYRGGATTLGQAVALGQAMQLTNILRDVGEDLARGRIYLPREVLARHGYSLHELRRAELSDAYRAAIGALAAEARRLYRRGWQGVRNLVPESRLAVAVAALSYEAILDDLARHRYDNFHRRAHVSNALKLRLLPRAWMRAHGPG